VWLGVFALAAGCRNPAGPRVEQPAAAGPPTITCPADVTNEADQAPATVSYSLPVVTGGTSPISTECTIASGATFPAGTSDVLCTATDATQRRAQCVFHVSVNVVARLRGTTFLAFGDSITWGEVSQTMTTVHQFDPSNNYPVVLEAALRARYPSQASDIVVTNAGAQGETAQGGEDRLVKELSRGHPDVLLLMEGINDVNGGAAPETIEGSLRADINRALRMGTKLVLVSTLLPEVPGRFRAYNPDGVPDANDAVRGAVAREGGVLVDGWSVFDPVKEVAIGVDGLHPTVQGYQLLAKTFLAAIDANFEAPPATTAGVGSSHRGPLGARPSTPVILPAVPRLGHP
jgi:lysophospholipase L1-like esterase